jgi:hypothetical protein
MILFAIGPWGELIPNNNYVNIVKESVLNAEGVEVTPGVYINSPNPTRSIVNAVLSAITYCFEMSREHWNWNLCELNEIRVRAMQTHCAALFQQMAVVSRHEQEDPNVQNNMGKFHSASHLTFVPWLTGDMGGLGCGSMESFHRWAVTMIYKKTSGRYDSNNQEMAKRTQEHQVQVHDEIARNILESSSVNEFLKSLRERDRHPLTPLQTSFVKAGNARKRVWNGGTVGIAPFMHTAAIVGFETRMDVICPRDYRNGLTLNILTGVRYLASTTSAYQDGIIYCTPRLGTFGCSRYSAISFMLADHLRIGIVLAAVRIEQRNQVNENSVGRIIFHVALMDIDADVPDHIREFWPFTRYKYQTVEEIICINATDMLDHVFLYPDYIAPESGLSKTRLAEGERYWHLPRNLFDRRGLAISPDFCELACGTTVATARAFILHNRAEGINTPYPTPPPENFPTHVGAHSQGLI